METSMDASGGRGIHQGKRLPAYGLISALIVLGVAFVAATAVTQHRSLGIDAPTHAISGNATKAVERLAAAGMELRDFERLALDEATEAPSEERRREMDASRRLISTHLKAYLDLPYLPGEDDIWHRVQDDLRDLDAAIARNRSALRSGERTRAAELFHNEIRPLIERASDNLDRAIAFNAGASRDLADDIRRVRRQTLALAVALDVVCIVALFVIVILGLRAARRYEKVIKEHRVSQARRIEELDAFSARVAHDILSPLGGVSLALDLAARRQSIGEASGGDLARAQVSLQRVKRIVEDLLEFARSGATPEAGARANVREVIEGVVSEVRPMAAEARAQLIIERLDDGIAGCTPGVLASLVSNLVRNAVKYLGSQPVRIVKVRALTSDVIRIEVEDTGPGIAPALHESLFKPYVRGVGNQVQGLGLGLATVKRLADAYGGRVSFQSVLGKGATFWFQLPRAV
jgi:signal transduction histidine kinase